MLVYRAIVDCERGAAHAANVGTIGLRSNPAEQASGQRIRTGGGDTTRNDKIGVRANRTKRQPTAHRVLPGGSIPGIPAMEGAEGCCRAPAADDPPIGSRFELMSAKMPGLITRSAETGGSRRHFMHRGRRPWSRCTLIQLQAFQMISTTEFSQRVILARPADRPVLELVWSPILIARRGLPREKSRDQTPSSNAARRGAGR
jgi:hypothetical protein